MSIVFWLKSETNVTQRLTELDHVNLEIKIVNFKCLVIPQGGKFTRHLFLTTMASEKP